MKDNVSSKNILILGATGRVGGHITSRALQEGHHVTALIRTPEKINMQFENLTIIKGNVLNEYDLQKAISGIDVVISALNTDGTTTLSKSIPLILEAMKSKGINRIITIGTAGILQSRISPKLLRYQSTESRNKSTRATEEHHRVYDALKKSDLEWTIVCPTYLTEEEFTGVYRFEPEYLPEDGVKISVQDTAELTYNQIFNREYINVRIGIAY